MSSCKTRDFPDSQNSGDTSYGYYSRVLNKPFDTLDALKKAEEEFKRQNDEKVKAQEEKKARAKEIEDAYLNYQKVKEEAYTQIAEAEKKWIELKDKFVEDYGGYHMTYSNTNGNSKITFGDFVDSLFSW